MTTFFAFVAALEASLAAHFAATGGFEDVGVVKVSTDETPFETVVLVRPPQTPGAVDVDATQQWAALGASRRDDEYTVPARVVVQRTAAESSDAFTEAGERAEAIVSEMISFLTDSANWPAVGDQVLRTIGGTIGWQIYQTDIGWVVAADVDIDVRVRVS